VPPENVPPENVPPENVPPENVPPENVRLAQPVTSVRSFAHCATLA
jgi:hypothetical protein